MLPGDSPVTARCWFIGLVATLFLSASMLVYMGLVHAPNLDEAAHLPAGCLIVQSGHFDLYKVNPPLVKTIAAVPVVLAGPKFDWSRYTSTQGQRSEFAVGQDFILANGKKSFWYFAMGRWALIPIWLGGGVVIYRWATALGGRQAGFAAILMWCFSPNVLAWTATICPDSPAASIGILCCWCTRSWLIRRDVSSAFLSGLVLGMALLTKTSWITLIPVIVLLTFAHRPRMHPQFTSIVGLSGWRSDPWKNLGATVVRLLLLFTVAIYTVNVGYGFAGTMTRLGDFRFASSALTRERGDHTAGRADPRSLGNRFSNTCLASVPIPLPSSFVEGMDTQKLDFEVGKWSYLRGEHKRSGWWYWYAYALLVKVPTGVILLAFTAFVLKIRHTWRDIQVHGWSGLWTAGNQEKMILLLPAAALFTLVSTQTGFSRYLRYILPCFPFAYILVSQVFSSNSGIPSWMRISCWGFLSWSCVASLMVFPHSLSYFNEIAGGSENGPAHLLGASIDWGQDALFLADWIKDNREAEPLYGSLNLFFDASVAEIRMQRPPLDPRYVELNENASKARLGPQPGWYAISVNELHDRERRFAYLFDFRKEGMVGYSIYLYRLTQQQVDDWNRYYRVRSRAAPHFR